MDELPLPTDAAAYRCPGETHSIDWAVHLARLAAFYPPCRQCDCRGDARLLPPLEVRRWAELERRTSRGASFTAEGLEGPSANDVDPALARRFAGALAIVLWRRPDAGREPPKVVVGADGHWTTAELVSAACESLRLAGCRTVEAGAVTSASLAVAAQHLAADAALRIGNSTLGTRSIGLSVWGPSGRPWSAPGELDALRAVYESSHTARPKRGGGALERTSSSELYLAPMKTLFHGLRPLRFVVDTTCEPLVRHLGELSSHAACEVLRPRPSQALGEFDAAQPLVARRLESLGQRVVAEGAHFGLWIDGSGEACRAVDERGSAVECEKLFLALAAYVCHQQPGATLVVQREASTDLQRSLANLGARTVRCGPTRQATFDAMVAKRAVFGSGPLGRFWFAGDPPTSDALLALSLLLNVLSQSDRAVSEVLDASGLAV
jgi:phosphomannomutase